MTDFVVDKGVQRLIDQVLAKTKVSRADIGTIAGPKHRQEGPHFPEDPPPPGNPPHQVDAADFPHQPEKGLDCAVFTEELRLSRDSRLNLVIWNGHQFSSYAKNGIPPFTWRPYTGTDKHDTHAHVEVNDTHHDEVRDWMVFEMAGFPTAKEIADEFLSRAFPVYQDEDGVPGREGKPISDTLMTIRARTYEIAKKLDKDPPAAPVVLSAEDKAAIAAEVVRLLADQIIFIPKAKVAG